MIDEKKINRPLLIITGIVLFLVVAWYIVRFFVADGPYVIPAKSPEVIACAQDVKVCPDGTEVSRIPPNCYFERCPYVNESTSSATFMWDTTLCPQDKQTCPDGTEVSRSGPGCEFEECSASDSAN